MPQLRSRVKNCPSLRFDSAVDIALVELEVSTGSLDFTISGASRVQHNHRRSRALVKHQHSIRVDVDSRIPNKK